MLSYICQVRILSIEFPFFVYPGYPCSVPDVAEMALLSDTREKSRTKHGRAFALCPADAVVCDPI